MVLIDPKTPPRKDLEMICRGNQRLVKAFEKLFELIPSEFNKGNDDTAAVELTAAQAAAQANQANAALSQIEEIIQLAALRAAPCYLVPEIFDLSIRSELIQSDDINISSPISICSNPNFEIT